MTLLNSCQVLKSLACVDFGGNSIDDLVFVLFISFLLR